MTVRWASGRDSMVRQPAATGLFNLSDNERARGQGRLEIWRRWVTLATLMRTGYPVHLRPQATWFISGGGQHLPGRNRASIDHPAQGFWTAQSFGVPDRRTMANPGSGSRHNRSSLERRSGEKDRSFASAWPVQDPGGKSSLVASLPRDDNGKVPKAQAQGC